YGSKGHVDFVAVPETQVDDVQRTIALTIDLDEGSVFYVASLTVRGDESEAGARERLLRMWEGYEGRVYDSRMLERFLRDLHARPQVKPEQVFEVSEDAQRHLVNVYIILARPIL